MTNHYKLALLPDNSLETACGAYAQRHFKTQADGVLLDRESLPHVTLCRFAATPEQLPDLWQEAVRHFGRGKIALAFAELYFRKGRAAHDDHIWAGFGMLRDSNLVVLQASVYALLRLRGLMPLTPTGDAYIPHLTLARLRADAPLPHVSWPEGDLMRRLHDFRLSLGVTDANGVYQRRLFPEN
ncbi:MAG: hypothetical protein WBK91_10040 [Alphaproteobacteria bacterium]